MKAAQTTPKLNAQSRIETADYQKDQGYYVFQDLTPEARGRKSEILSQPIEAIDLEKINTVEELVRAYGNASIQARNLGSCAQVWEQMLTDADRPTVFLGLAGPLIAAGLRKVIRDIIHCGLVDCVVSTGAILYQDIYQAKGFKHYRGDPKIDDRLLRDLYVDRIYDTYVDEDTFWRLDCSIGRFADTLKPGLYSSRQFLEAISATLNDENSILAAAHKRGIPVFSPAINDSSIGIGITEHYHRCVREGRQGVVIDSIRDNYELTQVVINSKATAAVYIAGGVPKNFINDSVVMSYIFGKDTGGHRYAIQLTTDVPHWGGLSGSTLSEATSWGKVSKKASHAMCFVEPSVSLPLVAGYCVKRGLGRKRPALQFSWDSPRLTSLKTVG
ncbi:MAG: deoxyhypusine synthase family protein [Deltaproteobacteria bacterium]|nr:deoxyhypusine synthase family protein [Deltaproteobacteria bacterium]